MAVIKGNEGTVSIGATVGTAAAVGELRGWELNISADTLDASVCGTLWKRIVTSMNSWTGKIMCLLDPADLGQDAAALIGTVIHPNMFPKGNGVGATDTYYHGDAVVTGIKRNGEYNGLVEHEITFEGNGALLEAMI